jgi:ABC transporter substrate binding protein (PQQ-dependent alcohol dehydrogenase system)|tara:strand:+ start:771 stop:1940 length:1170 start_codon:yes stop_codon:yes gene_type:complete
MFARELTFLLIMFCALPLSAQNIHIGLLRLQNDPRFDESFAYARIELRAQGDALSAVKMSINDMKIMANARGLKIKLSEAKVEVEGLYQAAQNMIAEEVTHIIVDLPGNVVDNLAASLSDSDVVVLNTTAPDDWLRSKCYSNLLHTAASDRMIADALVQHATLYKWKEILILRGKTPRDTMRADSFMQSAKRYRLRIVDDRDFDLSTNPALREENNIALITGGRRNYDAVYIADEIGEYARYVPYQVIRPRPVIGATGLVALEWHWALERYGAPQMNSRFEKMSADNRRMSWQDWSAWIATRAVLTAFIKSHDPTIDAVNAYLRSHKLRLDGSKGRQMNFRPWSGQLRMPILLATHNAIIGVAPLEGFLHQKNTLDALGYDEQEFICAK